MIDKIPNHEILKCEFIAPPERFLERYQREYTGLGNHQIGNADYTKRDDIFCVTSMMVMQHLGYSLPVDPADYLSKGVTETVETFCTDWWKQEGFTGQGMDKNNKNDPEWNTKWWDMFSNGLLLGLLSERWDDIDQICQWMEWDLPPGYIGEDQATYDYVLIYQSIAASLRSTPMPGVEELPERAKRFKRGPYELYESWHSVLCNDQNAFDKAFPKAVKQEVNRKFKRRIPIQWIVPYHSVVALAARRLGLSIPELPAKSEAAIITPESLGIK